MYNAEEKDLEQAAKLFNALENEDAESIRRLLAEGVQADVLNAQNQSPLHLAITHFKRDVERLGVCRSLLEHGAQLDTRDNDLRTPLHLALLRRSDWKLAELLIALGANVRLKDHEGRSPLWMASVCLSDDRARDLAQQLLNAGARPEASVLADAVERNKDEVIRVMLANGADCNVAAALAAKKGNIGLVRRLLKEGAEVDAVVADDEDEGAVASLLEYAIRGKNVDMVRYLVETAGADVDLMVGRRVPLTTAIETLEFNVISLLLKRIALLTAQDLYVHEENFKAIEDNATVGHKYKCYLHELQIMKSSKVCDLSHVTYFDILTKQGNQLVQCLICEEVRSAFLSGRQGMSFPQFANEMRLNYDKGMRRLQLIDGY